MLLKVDHLDKERCTFLEYLEHIVNFSTQTCDFKCWNHRFVSNTYNGIEDSSICQFPTLDRPGGEKRLLNKCYQNLRAK